VRLKVEETGITFEFTLTGVTDERQSLDLRFFGSLKMRPKLSLDDWWIRHGTAELTVPIAIALLMRV
jgi:hypothetical protein